MLWRARIWNDSNTLFKHLGWTFKPAILKHLQLLTVIVLAMIQLQLQQPPLELLGSINYVVTLQEVTVIIRL